MTTEESIALFKCLGDGTRLSILRILSEGDSYVELIASRLSLTAGTVSFHMKKLEAAGLVRCSRTQYYVIYSLKEELMTARILDCLPAAEIAPDDGGEAYRRQIITRFLQGGRLVSIPSQLKKREILWEHLVTALFEKDRIYDETEVNEILRPVHEDVCYLRREFISCGLMQRDHEKYVRLR